MKKTKEETCPTCNGTGQNIPLEIITDFQVMSMCLTCLGRGTIEVEEKDETR